LSAAAKTPLAPDPCCTRIRARRPYDGRYWLIAADGDHRRIDHAVPLLGVNRVRVRQLVAAGLLPFEQTPHGYAFSRDQLLTVANARRARFHAS
jgi:hypothetical protein